MANASSSWRGGACLPPSQFGDFRRAEPDQVVVVLKAREPARILIAIGDRASNRWHLQFAERWVVQYNFYLNDGRWGRMFVRMPGSAFGSAETTKWSGRRSA